MASDRYRRLRRVLCGVRVTFEYDRRTLKVRADPCEDSLRAAAPQDLLRFWVAIAQWAASVPQSSPGWSVV